MTKNFDDVASVIIRQVFGEDVQSSPDVQTRLYKLIDYAKDRFHWYEDQREKKLTIGLAGITLSGVALTVIVNSFTGKGLKQDSFVFYVTSFILLSLIIMSFSVICVYLRGQNLKYTHRQGLVTIFSWYGYGVPAIRQVNIFEFLLMGRYSSLTLVDEKESALANKKAEIIAGFDKFTRAVVPGLRDPKRAMMEDLQQIYILQVFQTISRDNLQNMIKCMKYGGILISILTLTLCISVIGWGVPTS